MEDYDIEHQIIIDLVGALNHKSIWAMTKKYQGVVKSQAQVFEDIANDMNASLAKGMDRIQNFQSMVGVFTLAKREAYVQEGKDWFLSMLKKARKKFPHQTDAYLNIETVIKYQIQLLDVINSTEYVESINSAPPKGA